MPYLDTTFSSVKVKDTHSNYWQQATVDVSITAAGKVSWKITMNNDAAGSRGRAVYLEVKLGDKILESAGYTCYYKADGTVDENTAKWATYPTGNGTSKSGTFTTTDSSLKLTVTICCMQNSTSSDYAVSSSKTLTRNSYTSGGKATGLAIVDNGNNTFTVSGKLGKAGTNNKLKSAYLYYTMSKAGEGVNPTTDKYTGKVDLGATSEGSFTKTITNNIVSCDTRAMVVCTYEHNTATTSVVTKTVKYYVIPKAPGKAVLQSFTRSRPTVKENWTYKWTAATAGNTDSPIKGYRIRIYKNGSPLKGLTCSTSNNTIGINSAGTDIWVNRESTSTTLTFNPKTLGFKTKDKIKVGLYAYTRNGEAEPAQMFNNGGASDAQVFSDETTVQSAGTVRVKVGGSWREGQVWVKVGGSWREAESVYSKAGGSWRESL